MRTDTRQRSQERTAADIPRSGQKQRMPQTLVPFIVRWSGERDGAMAVVFRRDRKGIRYADERSFDRDERGVLWVRTPSQPGRGRPEFGKVHSLRQRLCMSELRCQVCGGPADRSAEGVLWLVDAARRELRPGGEITGHPPVCRPCAERAVRACPHLRPAVVALRVRSFEPYGVNGALYQATHEGPKAVDAQVVPFGSLVMPWVRAGQLVMALRDFTVIDLDPASK